MREKRRFEMNLRFRSADGSYRHLRMVAAPRFMSDGMLVGFVGSMFDRDTAKPETAPAPEP